VPINVVIFVMKLELSRLIFEKYSDTKFNENLFTWSWVAPQRKTDNIRKLIIDFHNFVIVPKMLVRNCRPTSCETDFHDYKYSGCCGGYWLMVFWVMTLCMVDGTLTLKFQRNLLPLLQVYLHPKDGDITFLWNRIHALCHNL
jgi:hypothetical protein